MGIFVAMLNVAVVGLGVWVIVEITKLEGLDRRGTWIKRATQVGGGAIAACGLWSLYGLL